jgi:hypothetical protein
MLPSSLVHIHVRNPDETPSSEPALLRRRAGALALGWPPFQFRSLPEDAVELIARSLRLAIMRKYLQASVFDHKRVSLQALQDRIRNPSLRVCWPSKGR